MNTQEYLLSKLNRTQQSLDATIGKLLEINRKKREVGEGDDARHLFSEELRVLNATAEMQARSVKSYELSLQALTQA